jgi:hypothetical protein
MGCTADYKVTRVPSRNILGWLSGTIRYMFKFGAHITFSNLSEILYLFMYIQNHIVSSPATLSLLSLVGYIIVLIDTG